MVIIVIYCELKVSIKLANVIIFLYAPLAKKVTLPWYNDGIKWMIPIFKSHGIYVVLKAITKRNN